MPNEDFCSAAFCWSATSLLFFKISWYLNTKETQLEAKKTIVGMFFLLLLSFPPLEAVDCTIHAIAILN